MDLFITQLYENPDYFFMVALVVVFSICLHEYFHAQVALWEGDPTAADAGHLTLNPLRQMGVFSLIMFCLFGIAWGMVPVNPKNFRSRWSDLRVSFAGPFMNLLLFIAGFLAFYFLIKGNVPSYVLATKHFGMIMSAAKDTKASGAISLAYILGVYSFVLFTLNMIPAPGLDGWSILTSLFPKLGGRLTELGKGVVIFLILSLCLFITYLFDAGEKIMELSLLLLLR